MFPTHTFSTAKKFTVYNSNKLKGQVARTTNKTGLRTKFLDTGGNYSSFPPFRFSYIASSLSFDCAIDFKMISSALTKHQHLNFNSSAVSFNMEKTNKYFLTRVEKSNALTIKVRAKPELLLVLFLIAHQEK